MMGDRLEQQVIKADRNAMAGAGDATFDPERMAQSRIEAVGQDDQSRRDHIAIRQKNGLPFLTRCHGGRFCLNELDVVGDLLT